MDIETGAQEFKWTNAANLILFFHRRCAEIYRTLNDGHGTARREPPSLSNVVIDCPSPCFNASPARELDCSPHGGFPRRAVES